MKPSQRTGKPPAPFLSFPRYDPENTEEEFANEKNGRMAFGVVIADEDKRKYTEGLDYSDWATSRTAENLAESVMEIYISWYIYYYY